MSDVSVIVSNESKPLNLEVRTPAPVQVFVSPTMVYAGNINLESPKFIGNPTAPTMPVSSNDKSIATTEFVHNVTRFEHTQLSPSKLWSIAHFMGKHPSIIVVESSGEQVVGEIGYIDSNNIEVSFSNSISGKAYLT